MQGSPTVSWWGRRDGWRVDLDTDGGFQPAGKRVLEWGWRGEKNALDRWLLRRSPGWGAAEDPPLAGGLSQGFPCQGLRPLLPTPTSPFPFLLHRPYFAF